MQFPYRQQAIQAGVPTRLPFPGAYFVLKSAGAARKVDVQLEYLGQTFQTIPDITAGFTLPAPFDAVTITAAIDTVVGFFASPEPVKLGYEDGLEVSVPDGITVTNTAANRVPVQIDGGTINVTATGVEITNTDAEAVPVKLISSVDTDELPVKTKALATLVHQAAVAVGVAATALISDATLRKLVIRNDHATAKIALGGAGVTLANGAIVLLPGDIWREEDAAGAAWYAVSETAGTNVQVMGLK
jgi:hypothetical protein